MDTTAYLVAMSAAARALNAPPPYPLTVPMLRLWLPGTATGVAFQDAAGTTPAGVGDFLGKLGDVSGFNHPALQASGAARPVRNAYGVSFNGSSQFLTITGHADIRGGNRTWSAGAWVYDFLGNQHIYGRTIDSGGGPAAADYIFRWNVNQKMQCDTFAAGGNRGTNAEVTGWNLNQWHWMQWGYDAALTKGWGRIDGGTRVLSAAAAPLPDTDNGDLTIAKYIPTGGFASCRIGAFYFGLANWDDATLDALGAYDAPA